MIHYPYCEVCGKEVVEDEGIEIRTGEIRSRGILRNLFGVLFRGGGSMSLAHADCLYDRHNFDESLAREIIFDVAGVEISKKRFD